jgi:hypothetical protein
MIENRRRTHRLTIAATMIALPPVTEVPITEPTTTVPPTTVPPTTTPPTTLPPVTLPPTTLPPITAPVEPPFEEPEPEPEPVIVDMRVELKGEGKIRVNGKRIAGTGYDLEAGIEYLNVDISEYLSAGTNTIQVDYVRIALFCDPTLDVTIKVNGSTEVDRSTRNGDCNFEWNWTIDGTTGDIQQERNSG